MVQIRELGIVMIIMVRATFIEARTEVEVEEEVEACCIVVDVEAIVGVITHCIMEITLEVVVAVAIIANITALVVVMIGAEEVRILNMKNGRKSSPLSLWSIDKAA